MYRHLFSRKNLGIPYMLFLALFVMAPLFVLFYYAFTNGEGEFTMLNLTGFFSDPNTLGTLFYSFGIASVTTIVSGGVHSGDKQAEGKISYTDAVCHADVD